MKATYTHASYTLIEASIHQIVTYVYIRSAFLHKIYISLQNDKILNQIALDIFIQNIYFHFIPLLVIVTLQITIISYSLFI